MNVPEKSDIESSIASIKTKEKIQKLEMYKCKSSRKCRFMLLAFLADDHPRKASQAERC
jgi:hypothetical protein